MPSSLTPANHQRALPLERLLIREAPTEDAVPMDVVFVGAGPAGLAGAIELARLARADSELAGLEIAVLEKAAELGQHSLSGAVVNPVAFRELFPELNDEDFPFRRAVGAERVYFMTEQRALRIPTPPPMRNHGNYIGSLCEMVRWLGERAEGLGVNVFTGFPVEGMFVSGQAVTGVRTVPSGLKRDATPGPGFQPATELTARVVALSEGTRGPLTQAWRKWQDVGATNPQIFALGVKEIWETREPLDAVIHTMGWPVPRDAFGGSFIYPLEDRLVALGLVVGLDAPDRALDIHRLLQRFKGHPLVKGILAGGECVEWGAKTIPEGGYYSLPERMEGDGVVLLGDAAGFVDVPSLKGIHYAMTSGILAARAIFEALKAGDVSATGLASYGNAIRTSRIAKDLYVRRNMRLAFREGFFKGGARAALMDLTGGALSGAPIRVESDAEVVRVPGRERGPLADTSLSLSKVEGVYKSGNQTRDDVPSHLHGATDLPPAMEDLLEHMCPAAVYEATKDGLIVNSPNCIDCKATDVLGPRWMPREAGSGPRYRRM